MTRRSTEQGRKNEEGVDGEEIFPCYIQLSCKGNAASAKYFEDIPFPETLLALREPLFFFSYGLFNVGIGYPPQCGHK
jgi:hypothetical protein